ncbi:MAG: M28 family peptidase [Bacteroidetes bacterium]|nr:M28 family peptidase [Bacteroidota bacterium]
MKHSFGLLSLIMILLLASCGGDKEQKKDKVAKRVTVPSFDGDSAYRFVAEQVAFGPRVPGSPAHDSCAAYLARKLRQYGAEVHVQTGTVTAYDGKKLGMKNIIGSYQPGTNNRIFICAHWDSRPFADHDPDPSRRHLPVDGANDGASGVGVIMEIARLLSQTQPPIGIDLIFFDVEDYGRPSDMQSGDHSESDWGLGSQYWSRRQHIEKYFAKYGILLDMVGAHHATFYMELFSLMYAPDVVKLVWSTAARVGYASYFPMEEGSNITDDHYFINTIRKIPTIDIIHTDKSTKTGFFPYWHTTSDNMEHISPATLKAVGQTVMTVIMEEE